MLKRLFLVLSIFFLVLSFLFVPKKVQAADNSFVNIVNPVRGADFWDLKGQKPVDSVLGEAEILKQANLPATWLIRFDALNDNQVTDVIKNLPQNHEIGLFLEVTPTWTKAANVNYKSSGSWHGAGSAFLTGYEPSEREKLIDSAFDNFKRIYGYYPKSIGAWYIDSYSLSYMQKKYGIVGALIVADQHSTDSYQIWGQFWSTPYYPSSKNTLIPAQNSEDKLPVVITQWAARDPLNGYGKGVEESTYSVQPNDYIDYHNLGTNYFSNLLDIYTSQNLNQFNQIVVGLENTYSWKKYQSEYQNQINIISAKNKSGQFGVNTMKDFAGWYMNKFTGVSPTQVVVAKDPLGTDKFAVWFMNPFYRAGWVYNQDGSLFRDVRPYTEGRDEQCYSVSCDKLEFATFALWTIDEITRNQKFVLDPGKVKDIELAKDGQNYLLKYSNEAGRTREVTFMPRDIGVDGKVKSIDAFILDATSGSQGGQTTKEKYPESNIKVPAPNIPLFLGSILKFVLFLIFALFIPGFVLLGRTKELHILNRAFLSICIGIVGITVLSYLTGYLKIGWIAYLYIAVFLLIFISRRFHHDLKIDKSEIRFSKVSAAILLVIVAGTIFQSLAMIRSGWPYSFGLGFWGPIGHDGIWHQALINQLLQNVPPQNPGFAGNTLSNYHYFYDLLVAVTAALTQIPVLDLLYRFYPVLLSLLLGAGTYFLVMKLSKSKIAALLSLYFVYFAGSFGWMVEFIKQRHFGGESSFWANQPVSANLNPPFAISLVLLVALMVLVSYIRERNLRLGFLVALTAGSLIEFKVYAGVIVLGGLFATALLQFLQKRDLSAMKMFFGALVLSLVVFLPQNSKSGELLVFSPFWFVNSMINFPDRVGWERLALALQVAPLRGEWLKFFVVEGIALLIFIVGNLGTRFLALFSLPVFFKRRLWEMPEYLLIIFMSALAFLIPVFFIQKGNPWNTIQFFYYFIYFVAIFTGDALIAIRKHLPKYLSFVLLGILLIITPINAFVTFTSYLSSSSPSRLTGGEYAGLSFLHKLPDGVVLTYPFDKNERSKFNDPFPLLIYDTSNYVSAFSGKPVFVEDEIQQEILQNDYQKRLVEASDFFNGRDPKWSANFLKQNNIKYIYLPKIFSVSLDEESLNLKKVYDNEEVDVYVRQN